MSSVISPNSNYRLALLSGFGDLNVSKADAIEDKSKAVVGGGSQDELYEAILVKETDVELCRFTVADLHRRMRLVGLEPNDFPDAKDQMALVPLYRAKATTVSEEKKDFLRMYKFSKLNPKEQKAELAREQKETAMRKQREFQEELERLTAKGESWAIVKAMQSTYKSTTAEIANKQKKEGTFEASAGKMASMMEGMDSLENLEPDLPMIKIGDASVASPFTSRMPSIRAAVDIIRQGRCTLVTTIQMYQILALNCLISAYSLSVLHLDGIKYGKLSCLIEHL
jgi:cation-transporting ATPase 13A1